MKKITNKTLANVAPKVLAGIAFALSVTSCCADMSQPQYMTHYEREEYENWGILPPDIIENEERSARHADVAKKILLGTLSLAALMCLPTKGKKR